MLKLKLISHTPNPDEVIAKAAKLCYSSIGVEDMNVTDKECAKFVRKLLSVGHHSPIEHVSFTFALEGISRACSHQLVRHRIASFSQQSQRYVDLRTKFEYIIPPEIKNDEVAREIFVEAMDNDQKSYTKLVERLILVKAKKRFPGIEEESIDHVEGGFLPNFEEFLRSYDKGAHREIVKESLEDARYVFPNACETKLVFTMNARTIYNFLAHRCCTRAQWEIRELAEAMYGEIIKIAPSTFSEAGPSCASGPCPEGSMSCGKVSEMRFKYCGV